MQIAIFLVTQASPKLLTLGNEKKNQFQNCGNLTSIKVADDNPVYDSRNNCNAIISSAYGELLLGCKNTVIPDGVTYIQDFAFYGCSGLTTINIPNSVTSMASCAFLGVDIQNVVSLVQDPFDIFDYNSDTDSGTFSNFTYQNATLYVPAGTIDKYKATKGWKSFKNIVETDPSGIKKIVSEEMKTSLVYDINGRLLKTPQKGINIIGGKKVLVKQRTKIP